MARQKKLTSAALEKAQARIAGLKSVNPKLEFGKGMTVKSFADEAAKLSAAIDDYNTLLSTLDAKLNGVRQREKTLNAMAVQALRRVAADFGPDSDEYEKLGGTRTSERKKPKRKPKP